MLDVVLIEIFGDLINFVRGFIKEVMVLGCGLDLVIVGYVWFLMMMLWWIGEWEKLIVIGYGLDIVIL